MKYATFFIPLICLLSTIYIQGSMDSIFSYLSLWVYAPFMLAIVFSLLWSFNKVKSNVVGIAGTISAILAIAVYISASNYSGIDGQVGLIFVVMPAYQLIVMLILSLIGLLVKLYCRAIKRQRS